ncbi:MAG: response regulator [Holophagales bacterium]|jgi:CheY-like chemotaxis protein|nr:response regulator [Holophagales bacterium]
MPRLLLVDDNSSIHKIAVSLLASTDIEIIHAQSAVEAFDVIDKEGPFDVALIDTSMSEIDGWELLSRLRAEPITSNMPIALMAGVLDEIDPVRVENAPIQAFLRKPVELRDLDKSVKALMAAPVGADIPSTQPDTSVPSDLLILEEQDLLPDEAEETFPPTDTTDAEIQVSSAAPDINDETAQPTEETISLDLEELNFNDIDQLVIAESESLPKTDVTNCESPDDESDNSDNTVSPIFALESGAPEEEESEESSEQTPISSLDALPEDFDPTVFLDGNSADSKDESQSTSEKTMDEMEQIEGIHELLQREFEPLPLNISDNEVDGSPDDTISEDTDTTSEDIFNESNNIELQVTADTSEPELIIPDSNDEEDMKNVAVTLDSVTDQDSLQEQNILMPSASSLVSELLSDPRFIDAIAKAVAEKLKT